MVRYLSNILAALAIKCDSSLRSRVALFSILTLIVILIYGYHFGTYDQASHIPFLKKFADPSLFPHDRFIDLRLIHVSYFWLFFVPLLKVGILEVSMFGIYVVVIFLTFWSLWSLTKTMFRNSLSSLISLFAVLFPHFGISGFTIFEFSLLNRVFVLPFELIAFNWFLQKKYFRVFFLLGLLYNIHAVSVHFVLAMMLLDMVMRIRQIGILKLVGSCSIFFLGALPAFIWRFGKSGIDFTPHWEWFNILGKTNFFHLFHFISFDKPHVIVLSLGGITSIFLFYIFSNFFRDNRMQDKESDSNLRVVDASFRNFMIAGILILLTQVVASNVYPFTLIIQAQIVRVGMFITLFAYIYASHYVSVNVHSWRSHTFTAYVIALLFSLTPLILFIVHTALLLPSKIPIDRMKRALTQKMGASRFNLPTGGTYARSFVLIGGLMLCTIGFWIFAISYRIYQPGIYIFPPTNSFTNVQLWAKGNTSPDSLFITPPNEWGIYDVEWRVLSERSTVSTLSEILEAAFEPTYITYWKDRFEDVAPGALAQFRGNLIDNLEITKKSYSKLSTSDLLRIAKKYKAGYVVFEKSYPHKLPIVYQNDKYVVYKMR